MFLFGGFEVVLIVVVGLLLLAVMAVATGRGEPDPGGTRPLAIYLTAITFVALFVGLTSGYQVVKEVAALGLTDEAAGAEFYGDRIDSFGGGFSSGLLTESCVIDSDGGEECFSPPNPGSLRYLDVFSDNDAHTREAVRSGLVGLAALAVLLFHRKRLRDLLAEHDSPASPAGRVGLIYAYIVSFVSAVVVLGAAAASAYAIFRIALPDISAFGDPDSERELGIVALLSNGALALGAWWIFSTHWKRADTMRGDRPAPPPPPEPLGD